VGQIPQIAVARTECDYEMTLICSSSCDQAGAGERFEKIERFVPLVLGLHPNGDLPFRAEIVSSEETVLWRVRDHERGV